MDFNQHRSLQETILSTVNPSANLAEAGKGDGPEYKKFFNATLKKFGAKSINDLKGDQKKKFYAHIEKNWTSDDEEKKKSKNEAGKTQGEG